MVVTTFIEYKKSRHAGEPKAIEEVAKWFDDETDLKSQTGLTFLPDE